MKPYLKRLEGQLCGRFVLLGEWTRRRAAAALAADGSPEAVEILVRAVALPRSRGAVNAALAGSPVPVSALCSVWAESRDPQLAARMRRQGRLPSGTPRVRVLAALKMNRLEALQPPPPAGDLAGQLLRACADGDAEIAARAAAFLVGAGRDALREAACALLVEGALPPAVLQAGRPFDTACSLWAQDRDERLADWIRRQDRLPSGPPDVRALVALKMGRLEALKESSVHRLAGRVKQGALDAHRLDVIPQGEDDLTPHLLDACTDADPEISARALGLFDAAPMPQDPVRRALFFFLSGQLQRYEELDFDHRLLRAAYDGADLALRRRILARLRSSGDAALASVLHAGEAAPRYAAMELEEWQVALSLLRTGRRLEELWRLVFEAPPACSAEVLAFLHEVGYLPDTPEERRLFVRLRDLLPQHPPPAASVGEQGLATVALQASPGRATCLTFSADGALLAAGWADGRVSLWRVAAPAPAAEWQTERGSVTAVALSPDGAHVAAATRGHTVQIWDAAGGEASVPPRVRGEICALAFSPDGDTLYAGAAGRLVAWSSSSEWRMWLRRDAALRYPIRALFLSPDGSPGAAIAGDRHVELHRFPFTNPEPAFTAAGKFRALSPDGAALATVGSGALCVWDAADGKLKDRLSPCPARVALSSGGMLAAVHRGSGKVRLGQAPGKRLETLGELWGGVHALAFSPDGQALAAVAGSGTCRVWYPPWPAGYRTPLAAMTVEDLARAEQQAETLPAAEGRAASRFVAALLQHRFRHEITVEDAAPAAMWRFDIGIVEG